MEDILISCLGGLIVYGVAIAAVAAIAISEKSQGSYNETFPKGVLSILLYAFGIAAAGASLFFFPLLWGGLAVELFYLFIARPGLTDYGYQMCWGNESALKKDEELKSNFFKHHAVVMGVMLFGVAVLGQLSVLKTGTYENPVAYIMALLALYIVPATLLSRPSSEEGRFPWGLCIVNSFILVGMCFAYIYLI